MQSCLQLCCRMCLTNVNFNKTQSIFGLYCGYIIRRKIEELFDLQIKDTDRLTNICEECLLKVNVVHEIKLLFLESDEKLRVMLGENLEECNNTESVSKKSKDEPVQRNEETEEFLKSPDKQPHTEEKENDTLELLVPELSKETSDLPIKREPDAYEEYVIEKLEEYEEERLEEEYDLMEVGPIEKEVDEDDPKSQEDIELREVPTIPKCYMCDLVFDEYANLFEHLEEHSDYPSSCEKCGHLLETALEMNEHISLHEYDVEENSEKEMDSEFDETVEENTQKWFECEACEKTYRNLSSLNRHKKMHSGKDKLQSSNKEKLAEEKTYECKTCQEIFLDLALLRIHIIETEHVNEEALTFGLCGTQISNEKELIDDHGMKEHPKEVVFHQCLHCDQKFSTIAAIKAHSSTHIIRRRYKCRYCDKTCNTTMALAGHENSHTKKQPFTCLVCEKSFSQYTSMRRHHKIHTGEKPYQCDLCSKTFRQSSVMRTHRLIHTGEKPHQCSTCGKSFRDHSTLHKHKRLHTAAD